ncbi:hypothetical protein CHRY9390_00155 [Chryseobacterium aquaeductus]|uniref:Lipoprotein n=1 Tax=Chryseobacterium aquaeductus TaxID=2675056 RepID=A0A9N8QPH7_9FLAO|nr:hypothetical protein [Chryseobacterium aquaeductus]CAA7329516.1 hypothetical protein CHRY9390_00155 [Chryseobacterium potabilaquae]CAD7797356.1 hypothetical protein CHRY9390_00155 [Chryseobacterium aquaeductus]
MQKYLYLIIITFSLTSCYTYQRKKHADVPPENGQNTKKTAVDSNISEAQMKEKAAGAQNKPLQQKVTEQGSLPVNIQTALQPTKNYKIKVDGRAYKVIVDKWKGDSLVAHPVSKPEVILKFHKNQIDPEAIAEKRFSQPIADIITVVAYGGIGVGIWMLLR